MGFVVLPFTSGTHEGLGLPLQILPRDLLVSLVSHPDLTAQEYRLCTSCYQPAHLGSRLFVFDLLAVESCSIWCYGDERNLALVSASCSKRFGSSPSHSFGRLVRSPLLVNQVGS